MPKSPKRSQAGTETGVTTSMGSTLAVTTHLAISSDGTLKSAYEDPRIGLIHELKKEEVIQDMSRFGLDTNSKMEKLRRQLCAFWKDPLHA